jgi:hypothetical protein
MIWDDDPLLIQPKNTMPRIDAIWAFLSVDEKDGNEGVTAATIGNHLVPLIAADEKRLASLRPIAQNMAERFGMKIRLVKFHVREVIEEYGPSLTSKPMPPTELL